MNDSAGETAPSSPTSVLQQHQCAEFAGGPLDFIYAHTGNECKVDAARLLDWSMLPTADHVAEIMSNPLLRAQAVRVITDGVSQPVQTLSRRVDYNSRAVDDSLDSLALRRAFASGSTIIIEDAGKWHPPVCALCNAVFNDRWQYANGCYYITRSGNCGLPFHADEETTFVFQLAGSKIWHVADYAAKRLGASEVPPDAPVIEFVLQPGDAACIPPMCPHRTEAVGGGDSIHLTIGVRRFKAKDFLKDLVDHGIWRVPAFETEIGSIGTARDALIDGIHNGPAEVWERELAMSSIRVASGMADRGFELVWPDGEEPGRGSQAAAHDLVWRVGSADRSLIYYSGRFAVMDDAGLGALCEAVAERKARACTWQELLAEGRVPSAVQKFLAAAGWDLGGVGRA